MAFDPHDDFAQQPADELAVLADEHRAARRKTSIHRMQIGLLGLGAMVLLVGLAGIIQNSAAETQASSVAAATTAETADEPIAPMRDPLVDAGVVPELPSETAPVDDGLEALDPGEDMAEALGAESSDEQGSDLAN